ncbi:MAG: hypothetical protein ABEN55_21185 [Bradymonadaceae bacterium]
MDTKTLNDQTPDYIEFEQRSPRSWAASFRSFEVIYTEKVFEGENRIAFVPFDACFHKSEKIGLEPDDIEKWVRDTIPTKLDRMDHRLEEMASQIASDREDIEQ